MRGLEKQYRDRVYLGRQRRSGYTQRVSYQGVITHDEPLVPKCITYEDIDRCFTDFVRNEIVVNTEGIEFPTFRLFSNQRFSEYSQTWKHTDENGNLIVNFKTVSREKNPKKGNNQGGLCNIPGERWYTYLQRDVLQDNGDEAVEVYSMRQPYAVDLMFRVNVFTTKFEYLNLFNEKVHNLFKSTQCYIRPNGHYLPMTLDEITDESEHELNERKFYSQCFNIRVMGYITRPEDLKIEKFPKRVSIALHEERKNRRRERVKIFEEEGLENVKTDIEILFPVCEDSIEFTMDTDVRIQQIDTENVNVAWILIDEHKVDSNSVFEILDGNEVRIRINRESSYDDAKVILSGINLRDKYPSNAEEKPHDTIEIG